MKVYLLLALLVVAAEAGKRRKKPKPVEPHKPEEPHPAFDPHDPHDFDPHALLSKFKPDLTNLEKKIHDLEDGQKVGVSLAKSLLKSSEDIHTTADNINKNVKEVAEISSETEKTLEKVKSNTENIQSKQQTILKGQKDIQGKIVSEHDNTRKDIAKLESGVRKEISKVSQNQKIILDKLEGGHGLINKGISDLHRGKDNTLKRLQKVDKALDSSAEANAKGRAEIVELIRHQRVAAEEAFEDISETDEQILSELDKTEDSFEKDTDKILSQQDTTIKQLRDSRDSVVADLKHLQKEQDTSQAKLKEAGKLIGGDISDILSKESTTQHILSKCGSKCDLSKVQNSITHIKKQIGDIEHNLEKDISGILAEESKHQSITDALQKKVLKVLSSRTDKTLHELKDLEQELEDFIRDTENDIKGFGKSVQMVENTQGTIEHSLKKILDDLNKLSFLQYGFHSKKIH